MNPVDEPLKKKLYDELARAMLNSLEAGKITIEDSRQSASKILEGMEMSKNKEELLAFLEKLGKEWIVYNVVYLRFKGNMIVNQDDQKINEIQGKLKKIISN